MKGFECSRCDFKLCKKCWQVDLWLQNVLKKDSVPIKPIENTPLEKDNLKENEQYLNGLTDLPKVL